MVNDILVRTELQYRTDRVRLGVRRPKELTRIRRGFSPAASYSGPAHPRA